MKFEFLKKNFTFLVAIMAILITFLFCRGSFRYASTQENDVNPAEMTIRLELFTSNIAKTVRFYQDILGFKPLNSGSPTYQPIKNGQVVLGIGLLESLGNRHYFNTHHNDNKFGYGVEIVLEVDDISLIYNKVKHANVEIESDLEERPWGLKDFRLIDPNGYYIRVTSKD